MAPYRESKSGSELHSRAKLLYRLQFQPRNRKNMQPSVLPLHAFSGSSRQCGEMYGAKLAESISGFLHMETPPDKARLKYARACWDVLKRWNKPVADFTRGMAAGAQRPIEELTLLLLHEEIVHQKNCTGLGATGSATTDGRPVIGQNWDWHAKLYPWPNLLRIRSMETPATLTYSYPGLWASAGINEHGLSLVWTGGGYQPRVRPKVGVPTYALIAAILACRNCAEALALLRQTPNAGCFLFFIADAKGEVWVVEGIPKKVHLERCNDVIGRANHYECKTIVHQSKQDVPEPSAACNTLARSRRLTALLKIFNGKINRKAVEAMLSDEKAPPGQAICQSAVNGRTGMTIDSFYCLPVQREFWISRGVPSRHEYARHRV
jgi:isopenicillin-N N-acyltransferase-like protein